MKKVHLDKGLRRIWMTSAVIASLLLMFGGIAKGVKPGHTVEGMRIVGGEWQTVTVDDTDYWKVDKGKLWYANPADCEEFAKGVNCTDNDHRIGANDWPLHLHVNPAKTWDTTPHAPDNVDAIKQEETQKLWYVSIYLGGTWNGKELRYADGSNHAALSLGKDGSDGQIIYSDANFHSNCHGFALDQAGLSRFKIVMGDANDGIQMVLDEYFTEVQNPENGTYHTIMCTGGHSNWVVSDTGTAGCKKVDILAFKFRFSQTFYFSYNSPGRDNDENFWGSAPEYWDKD